VTDLRRFPILPLLVGGLLGFIGGYFAAGGGRPAAAPAAPTPAGDAAGGQIAELQGAKTNAIEVALHRALGRLRTHLEDDSPPVRKSQAGR